MPIEIETLIGLFLVATTAGFIDAIAGGGGLLTVPALLFAGIPPAQALATNKLQSSFGAFSASLYFIQNKIVSLKDMWFIMLCTFIGAGIGATAIQHINPGILTQLIPALLIAISLYFLFVPSPKESTDINPKTSILFALCVGGAVGFYDGFFGPGTGSIFAICFVALGHLPLVQATARTKVLNFTSNLTALLLFILAGLPIWTVGLTMAVGNFLGARLGAKMVLLKGQKWIRPLIILMSIAMALNLLYKQHRDWILSIFR